MGHLHCSTDNVAIEELALQGLGEPGIRMDVTIRETSVKRQCSGEWTVKEKKNLQCSFFLHILHALSAHVGYRQD